MRVLLAGESWSSTAIHVKGFDAFTTSTYQSGADALIHALAPLAEITYVPNHMAAREFPLTIKELATYDVVILSDIGVNTLLLHPDTWEHGERRPNRLKLLDEYVQAGGGLIMAGGYLSFQGLGGAAGFAGTPVEAALPVTMSRYDDRLEAPEGLTVRLVEHTHPIVRNLAEPWPYLLGLNQVTPKPTATLIATADTHPLLVAMEYGKGRSVAWTSDVGPHWCPRGFCEWPGYGMLWQQMVQWTVQRSGSPDSW